MTFNSFSFFAFFIIVLAITLLIQSFSHSNKAKHIFLLLSSYFFYAYWDWRFCFLLLSMTIIAYICTMQCDKRTFRVLGVVTPLIILGFFKYFNFFISSFCSLFNLENSLVLNIILPVGISFYTFQSLSYTIDVIKGKQKQVSFMNLALYISFFPQLFSGPIIKSTDFLPQLENERLITLSALESGIQIFVFGLFKKIVLADRLSLFVNEVYRTPEAFSGATLALAVISYSLQIYFDFSGYSDMAIACAKMLGYDYSRNFNVPYISQNVTEFWKRWHISLSTWLQQYLYFSLGGNRKGKIRTYLNLMITMVLGGLWHGASWNFIIWGALHGGALCVHKFYLKHKKSRTTKRFIPTSFSVLGTFIFVSFCWIFFRAENFNTAQAILSGIFTWQDGITHMYLWTFIAIIILFIATIISHGDGFYPIFDLLTVKGLFILFVAIALTLGLAYVGDNPFIYFQF
ncbi:alginate O-acetyltransferase complex protein AlgI [Lachnospiraceae bacterium PF1-22]|uniref:MBOAT family O-acyltransferase n=1 Tax=Ohessyouella blattaphilus TaxID=2949333 RepID=UPI003E2731BA